MFYHEIKTLMIRDKIRRRPEGHIAFGMIINPPIVST